jgi:hypothetical protein
MKYGEAAPLAMFWLIRRLDSLPYLMRHMSEQKQEGGSIRRLPQMEHRSPQPRK